MKIFLKFNNLSDHSKDNPDIILFHIDALKDKKQKDYIQDNKSIKICVGKSKDLLNNYDASLELPTTLKEINTIVENTAAKKKFNVNSSILLKTYLLNKNEKTI